MVSDLMKILLFSSWISNFDNLKIIYKNVQQFITNKSKMIKERNKLAEETIHELLENIERLKREKREMKNGYARIKSGMENLFKMGPDEEKWIVFMCINIFSFFSEILSGISSVLSRWEKV